MYRPAKNKVMVLVANRYVIHIVVAALVLVTVFSNIQTDDVRAETFGQKSLLFSLVAVQDELIEEYASDQLVAVQIGHASYREQGSLSSFTRGVDFIGSLDDSSSTALSETSLVGVQESDAATAVAEAAPSADRTGIETYAVAGGDTLSTIASKFDLSLNTILWANSLSVSTVLQPGDSLTILPVDGVYHEVESGDTIASISQSYDVDQETITSYNGLANANALSIGDELLIPGGEVRAVSRSTSSAISNIITPTVSTGSSATISSPTVTGSGSMVWPTDLRVITQYYGWSHTGLDIDCHYTNDNYASDAGYVQYSGWKGGYGYTIEINHGNGIVTRYGHHSSLYVSAGEYVAQGQAIGRCGTTGRSTGTHLHYEVISNGSFRNPLEYIR
jgi:LysM repeat protein